MAEVLPDLDTKIMGKNIIRIRQPLPGLPDDLDESNRALEERVQQRIEELQRINEELVKEQEQLVSAEKLAAVGQMAGGIAHDLNNPLSAIKNSVFMINRKLSKDQLPNSNPRIKDHLDTIASQIERLDRTVADLLSFARVTGPALAPTELNKVIDGTVARMPLNKNVKLSLQVDEGLGAVMADEEQLQRVFLDLSHNAQEAMPDGGELTVAAKHEDGYIEVSFTDTGFGIPEENIERIFDPLFTTKPKGTGLGLAICQMIITRHGGIVTVRRSARPESGTTFAVSLPSLAG